MTRSRVGLFAGIAGAALAAWYWRSRKSAQHGTSGHNGGEVIFRNTPVPSNEGVL